MTRLTLAAFAVILLATPATGADLATEIGELKAAVQDRVDEIGPTPATKAEKKEAKKLGKAIPYLDAWVGSNDIDDFVTLGKAAKSIWKSKTTDPTIRDEVVDVLSCLIDIATGKKGLAQEVADKLYEQKFRDKVMKYVGKGDTLIDRAKGYLQTDYPKCHKAALKAWKSYAKGETKGEKYAAKANAGVPSGMGHVDIPMSLAFHLYNDSSRWYFVRDVIVTGTVTEWLTQKVVGNPKDFGIATLAPDYFKIQEFPGGGLDGLAMIHKRYPGEMVPTHDLKHYISHWLDIALKGRTSLHMFDGTIVLVISNKHEPGGNEKIFQYVIQTSGHRF